MTRLALLALLLALLLVSDRRCRRPGGGVAGADQGPRRDRRGARQRPARLRARRRPQQLGRLVAQLALHRGRDRQPARAARGQRHRRADPGEERRRRAGHRDAAAVRAGRRPGRRDGLGDRRRLQPARRHAGDDAAQRRRRPDLRGGAGRDHRRRRRRRGRGGDRDPGGADLGADPGRRPCRARGRLRLHADARHPAGAPQPRLHHRGADRGGDQPRRRRTDRDDARTRARCGSTSPATASTRRRG